MFVSVYMCVCSVCDLYACLVVTSASVCVCGICVPEGVCVGGGGGLHAVV